MSSGSASTTGPGRPEVAVWKARATSSGSRAGSSTSVDPLGDVAEHLAVVDLLERLAAAHRARDLADQAGSSGVESWRAMWTPWQALVAPGPRVTIAMPGRPVSLP